MVLELQIENRSVALAVQAGIASVKLNLAGNRGWPDRLFLYRGHTYFMEFKRPGEVPTDIQNFRLRWLLDNGYDAGWTDSITDCLKVLTAWKLSILGKGSPRLL
jgi:hypothetical protein